MKKFIKKALLMALLAFLCGTQGYAVKLNSKGQKMVKSLTFYDFKSEEVCATVDFDYDKQLNLCSVSTHNGEIAYTITKDGNNISCQRYEDGKVDSYYHISITTDSNGNITRYITDCDDNVNGGKNRHAYDRRYAYDDAISDYRVVHIEEWSLYVTPNGKEVSANGNNEHGESDIHYYNGGRYSEGHYYSLGKDIMDTNGTSGQRIFGEKVDDTNVSMYDVSYGVGMNKAYDFLCMTEWMKGKTLYLVEATLGKNGLPSQTYEYEYDAEDNIVGINRRRDERIIPVASIEYVE